MTKRKRAKPKKPRGRPSKYTPALGDVICALLAEGKSLSSICRLEKMPYRSTVLLWVVKGWNGDAKYKAFSDTYREAREAQAESLFDDLVDIADDDKNDYGFKEAEDGNGSGAKAFILQDNINRAKLRVHTRQWVAARILQRKYGDKIQQEITGKDGGP